MNIKLDDCENQTFTKYPKWIQEILNRIKNDVSGSVDTLLSQDDFESIFLYLSENYAAYSTIPDDIQALLNNQSFLKEANNYIKHNINNILNNNGIFSFEEISFCFFLLSFGKYNGILQDLNTYDIDLLWKLVDHIIWNILHHNNTPEKQENYYQSFLNLSDLVNTLCILNEVDSVRKNLIPKFTKLLTEKIIGLKNKLKQKEKLTFEKNQQLEYLIARFWINFSHTLYISTEGKILDEIILWFSEIIKKQIESYQNALDTAFWWNPHKIEYMEGIFYGNLSYTILVMINKIKDFYKNKNELFNTQEVLDNAYLQDVTENFFSTITNLNTHPREVSIMELETICNNIFANIYFGEKYMHLTEKTYAQKAITDFMSQPQEITSARFESIHHLVMFLPELQETELLNFWNFLLSLPKFNNYNFEFFKLKTFDLIVSRLAPMDNTSWKLELNLKIKKFLTQLTTYIEKNKIASQLLHTYSRIYLTIAYYYAFCFGEEYQDLSLEHFSVFSKMNGDKFEYEKYGKDLEEYYHRIGSHKLIYTLCKCEDIGNCGKINNCNFTYEQVITFWEKKVIDYRKWYEPIVRNAIDDLLQKLLDDALSKNSISDEEINKKISEILSSKVFHWIAETTIFEFPHGEDIHKADIEGIIKKRLKLHNGIACYIVDLFNGYKLVFSYPKICEAKFKEIFQQESTYIVINIKNIITGYLKKRDSFLDQGTWLPNEAKLKTLLLEQKEPISFINLKLSTIKSINNGYSYDHGDEYMKNVWQALSSIPELAWNIFRLSWAKFWIIIKNNEKIDEIIQKINALKVIAWGIEFKLDFFIWIVVNELERIVEKSSSALSYARKKWGQHAYYSEQMNDLSQDKKDLEYLRNLDKAIEDDKVVPFFQPIIDTKTGKVIKYEALMRVQTQDGIYDSPLPYLSVAKKFWRLDKLAYIMIEKVFAYASTNKANFSINLSGDDLSQDEILLFIQSKLEEYHIVPKRITFEILEWEWTEDNQNNINGVMKLREMWFRIAMDDFWANSSNMNRLIDFLSSGIIDDLKIDGKMIQSLSWENKRLKEEIERLSFLLHTRLKINQNIHENANYIGDSDSKNLLTVHWEISQLSKKLSIQYLYLKKYIDAFIWCDSPEKITDKKEIIFSFIDNEANKFASPTKKMLAGIVDASHDVWVKVTAEFVDSEKIRLICDVIWIDALQWYTLWQPQKDISEIKV